MKLNLGCGKDLREGFVNADMFKSEGVDKVMDINSFPWPLKDNQFEYVLCSRIIEYSFDIGKVMNELHRITKDGGIIEIISPYHKSEGAFKHASFVTKDTPTAYVAKTKFKVLVSKNICQGKLRKFIPFKKFLDSFLWNIYDTIHMKIQVRK